jgi:hypothetical protein
MREKSAVKKTNVHRALKIYSSGDSDSASGLKENPAPEKEILVEKDQITNAEGKDNSGPKGNPLPDKESVVEKDMNDHAEGKYEGEQKDNTTPIGDAPSSGKKTNSPTTSTKNGNEVNLIFNPLALLLFKLLIVLTGFSFVLVG